MMTKFIRNKYTSITGILYVAGYGICKPLKPEYRSATSELHGHHALSAATVNLVQNVITRFHYYITGVSTLLYHKNGDVSCEVAPLTITSNFGVALKEEPLLKFRASRWPDSKLINSRHKTTMIMTNESFLGDRKGSSNMDVVETSNTFVPTELILELTDDNFKKMIDSGQPIVVMFYAPWCKHCKDIKPAYVKAAAELKSQGFTGKLAMLDCTKYLETAETYEIAGFPTIMLFRNGRIVRKYKGNRTTADLVQFARNEL